MWITELTMKTKPADSKMGSQRAINLTMTFLLLLRVDEGPQLQSVRFVFLVKLRDWNQRECKRFQGGGQALISSSFPGKRLDLMTHRTEIRPCCTHCEIVVRTR